MLRIVSDTHDSRATRIKAAAMQLAKLNLAWLRGEGREELRTPH